MAPTSSYLTAALLIALAAASSCDASRALTQDLTCNRIANW